MAKTSKNWVYNHLKHSRTRVRFFSMPPSLVLELTIPQKNGVLQPSMLTGSKRTFRKCSFAERFRFLDNSVTNSASMPAASSANRGLFALTIRLAKSLSASMCKNVINCIVFPSKLKTLPIFWRKLVVGPGNWSFPAIAGIWTGPLLRNLDSKRWVFIHEFTNF